MRINNNLPPVDGNRQQGLRRLTATKSTVRLASSQRANSSADDAAGLAISGKSRGQLSGLTAASRTLQDGISLIQTAQGGLEAGQAALGRMGQLAAQAADSQYTDDQRGALDAEYQQLLGNLDSAASSTRFGGEAVLDGSYSAQGGQPLAVSSDRGAATTVAIDSMSAQALGLEGSGIATLQDAHTAAGLVQGANDTLAGQKAALDASQSALAHHKTSIDVANENLNAAAGRVRDVDMARQMAQLTVEGIRRQAPAAVSAQANVSPESVLRLVD